MNKKVEKILTKNKKALGITDESGNVFNSDCVISNCDVTQTYSNLIDDLEIRNKYQPIFKEMVTSSSVFIVYLGLNRDFFKQELRCGALWYLTQEDEEAGLEKIFKGEINYNTSCIMIAFPSFHDKQLAPVGKSGIYLMCNANFKNIEYWNDNKEKFADNLIDLAEKVIPRIKEHLQVKIIATPQTLHRYTLNRNGAIHGWAALLSQIDSNIVPMSTDIKGLYLTGHWLTHPGQGGIPMVAYSASRLVKFLLKNILPNRAVSS